MARPGRPREGGDPAKREAMRRWYQRKTPDERRAWVARRDPDRQRAADNARHARDPSKRNALHALIARRERRDEPEKPRARKAAQRDNAGRERACARCGSRKDVQLHHPDHRKPREVVALCARCHGATRRKDDARDG